MTTALTILAPILILCAVVWLVVARGLQLSLLCKDGEPAKGRITEKIKRKPQKQSMQYYLKYSYKGWNGEDYEHKSLVSYEIFEKYDDGDLIDIIVSKSKPSVSAPTYLVEQAKTALKK